MSMQVFVINLNRCPDRKQYVTGQLETLGLPHEVIEAVDGQRLFLPDVRKEYGLSPFPPGHSFNARHLTRGEIGCLLSHLGIYRRIVDDGIEQACIFEDDVYLHKDLPELLHFIASQPFSWEILMLGHQSRRDPMDRGAATTRCGAAFMTHYRIARPAEAPFGSYAYVIDRRGAEILLRHAFPLRMPMDCLLGHSPAVGLNLSLLVPPCIAHEGTRFDSLIRAEKLLYLSRLRRLKRLMGDRYPFLRKGQRWASNVCASARIKFRAWRNVDPSFGGKKFFGHSPRRGPDDVSPMSAPGRAGPSRRLER